MRGFHFRRWVVVSLGALLCLLLFSSEGTAGRLHGKVKKRIYHSPEKTFSVPIPAGTFSRRKVSDHYQAESQGFLGSVSFHDDMGNVEGILYMKRPEGFEPSEGNWRLWLHKVALPGWFKRASPESRLLREEPFTFEGMDAYRALVELPGGSPVMDMVSGRRFDSRRGLVLFERGCCLWVLMTETLTLPTLTQGEPEPVADDWADFTPTLKSFYEAVRFRE